MVYMLSRQRVVVLGAGKVGKTSILMKYLNGTFSLCYNPTVEDLYDQEVCVDGQRFHVDFLDTSGSIPFPAMRVLAIQKAQAFILVYAIDSEDTFLEMKARWNEIKEFRPDYKDIPCLIIGNKADRENYREVEFFEALNWADNNGFKGMMQEVSMINGTNLGMVFELLLKRIKSSKANVPEVLQQRQKSRWKRFASSMVFSCCRKPTSEEVDPSEVCLDIE